LLPQRRDDDNGGHPFANGQEMDVPTADVDHSAWRREAASVSRFCGLLVRGAGDAHSGDGD
jgi:hypothetical protein